MITKTENGYNIDGIELTSTQAWEIRLYLADEWKREYIDDTYPKLDEETKEDLLMEWKDMEDNYDDNTEMLIFECAYERVVGEEEEEE